MVQSIFLLQTHGTVGHQSMGFSKQKYWSGLSFPYPGDLPNPRKKSKSPIWQADSLELSYLGNPMKHILSLSDFRFSSGLLFRHMEHRIQFHHQTKKFECFRNNRILHESKILKYLKDRDWLPSSFNRDSQLNTYSRNKQEKIILPNARNSRKTFLNKVAKFPS